MQFKRKIAMKYIRNNPIVYVSEILYAFIYDLNKNKVVYKYKLLHDKQTSILNQLKKVKNYNYLY